MIDSFNNVNKNFYQQIAGLDIKAPINIVTHKGESIDVPVVYAKESSKNLVERTRESYPMISLYDYTPQVVEEWYREYSEYFAGWRLKNEADPDEGHIVTQYTQATPFKCTFDIALAALRESDIDAMRSHMYNILGFTKQKHFVFNKKSIPLDDSLGNQDLGDLVLYDYIVQEPVRTDGVHEVLFKVNLFAWINMIRPVDKDVLETVEIRINQDSESITIENNG